MRTTPVRPILLIALLAGAASVAVAEPPDQPALPTDPAHRTVTRIFSVRHVDARPLAAVLEMYGGAARPQPELGVVAWSGPADQLAVVEAAVATLDVAPAAARDLVLTAWLVAVSKDGTGSAELPTAVRTAIERLGDARPGPDARLLERALLRVREGSRETEIRGKLVGPAWSDGSYTLRVRHVAVLPRGAAQAVRLDGVGLRVDLAAPAPPEAEERGPVSTASLSTEVDLELGRAAVVGATALPASGASLVLVLRVARAE